MIAMRLRHGEPSELKGRNGEAAGASAPCRTEVRGVVSVRGDDEELAAKARDSSEARGAAIVSADGGGEVRVTCRRCVSPRLSKQAGRCDHIGPKTRAVLANEPVSYSTRPRGGRSPAGAAAWRRRRLRWIDARSAGRHLGGGVLFRRSALIPGGE